MSRRETRQRELILRILSNTDLHPTADQVYDAARLHISNISKGTVYRNLRILVEDGLVSELDLSGTVSRYEIMQDRHYHFRCDICGRVYDLEEPVHDELDETIAKQTGFTVTHHQTEFRGVCSDCRNKGL